MSLAGFGFGLRLVVTVLVVSAAAQIALGCISGVRLLGCDDCKKRPAHSARLLEHLACGIGNVVGPVARNPIGLLATVCRLGGVVVVLGGLLTALCFIGEIASSRIPFSIASSGGHGMGWLRVDTSLFCNRFCSLYAGA